MVLYDFKKGMMVNILDMSVEFKIDREEINYRGAKKVWLTSPTRIVNVNISIQKESMDWLVDWYSSVYSPSGEMNRSYETKRDMFIDGHMLYGCMLISYDNSYDYNSDEVNITLKADHCETGIDGESLFKISMRDKRIGQLLDE